MAGESGTGCASLVTSDRTSGPGFCDEGSASMVMLRGLSGIDHLHRDVPVGLPSAASTIVVLQESVPAAATSV